jgi:hypothetical protein
MFAQRGPKLRNQRLDLTVCFDNLGTQFADAIIEPAGGHLTDYYAFAKRMHTVHPVVAAFGREHLVLPNLLALLRRLSILFMRQPLPPGIQKTVDFAYQFQKAFRILLHRSLPA